jgi:hypothetical protein
MNEVIIKNSLSQNIGINYIYIYIIIVESIILLYILKGGLFYFQN